MKKICKLILAALALSLVVLYWTVPRKAVNGEYILNRVEKNGHDITEQLSDESLTQIKELAENAESTRWKNPLGAYPIYEDSVAIYGFDDDGRCIFTLAGCADKYGVEDRMIRDGKALWKAVLELLP